MKRALSAFALLGALLTPELAAAKAVEDVRLDTDASDVIVTVVADETLAVPAVRTAPGSVRVRFYDAKDTRILRLNGDGSAVRAVDLTRGSDQTAALTINFGDRTKLAPADVRVESEGDTITLRIARGLLPAVRQVPGAPAVPAQAKSAPAPVAAKEPAAQPAPAASTVTVRTEEAKAPSAPAAKSGTSEKGALGTKAAAAKSETEELKLEQKSSSPMPILIAVTALLGLAYGGMQLMIRKKKIAGTEIPAIDVVAQRRIGPRHQLVIVRAFDRDYLLSVQGGQTTVVARSSRKRLEEAEALLTPVSQRRHDDLAARAFGEDDEPTFGGELFKNVLEERERARNDNASMRLERAYREPTNGYGNGAYNGERREPTSSIKSERREPTSSIKSERRDPTAGMRLEAVRAESRAEREREEESLPAPPASAVSDSVSGLLRLRKQSGR